MIKANLQNSLKINKVTEMFMAGRVARNAPCEMEMEGAPDSSL